MTVVAVTGGRVAGTANAYANRPGARAHIDRKLHGRRHGARSGHWYSFVPACDGVGEGKGFAAMQFNAVADPNRRAVDVYQRLGLEIWVPCPERFTIPRSAGSACTSCTADSEPSRI
nr:MULTISPECIES: hypothetical protein [Nocardia]